MMWMALGASANDLLLSNPVSTTRRQSRSLRDADGGFSGSADGPWPGSGAWRRCIFIFQQHIPVRMTLRPFGWMCRWRTFWRRYRGLSPASGAWRRQGRKRPPPTAARRASPPPMAARPAPPGERPLSDICSHNCPAVLCAHNQQWYLVRAASAHHRYLFPLHEKVSCVIN